MFLLRIGIAAADEVEVVVVIDAEANDPAVDPVVKGKDHRVKAGSKLDLVQYTYSIHPSLLFGICMFEPNSKIRFLCLLAC